MYILKILVFPFLSNLEKAQVVDLQTLEVLKMKIQIYSIYRRLTGLPFHISPICYEESIYKVLLVNRSKGSVNLYLSTLWQLNYPNLDKIPGMWRK
jgi:hypothetical protein